MRLRGLDCEALARWQSRSRPSSSASGPIEQSSAENALAPSFLGFTPPEPSASDCFARHRYRPLHHPAGLCRQRRGEQ